MIKDVFSSTIELKNYKVEHNYKPNEKESICEINTLISYNDFFERIIYSNRPCILKVPNLIEDWISSRQWVEKSKPCFSFLSDKYGSVEVPVANCNEKYYNAQKTTDIKLDDFITYWKDYSEKGHPSDMPSLYLKDWHFPKDFPEANIYQVPKYFASDWLNEYLCGKTSINDDYRFVYMGPKGSWTPFHADVFTSFSWSANVCGCKRWLLFPPGQENNLRDKFGRLAYDATAPELHDRTMFPNYHKLCGHFEIVQKAGEVIFVPSGWHHQVWNLEDTISINHNWVNGCNIKTMWDSLQNNLLAVKKEVEDYRAIDGWEDHCQLMLRATYGMNYEEFYNFLHFIATRRLDYLGNNNPNIMFGEWKIGINHAIFDLVQLKKVLDLLLCDSNIKFISFFQNLGNQCDNLRNDINSTFLKVTRHTQ